MGKRVTASDMLQAGRRPSSKAETLQLDSPQTSQLVAETPSSSATPHSSSTEGLGNQATSRPVTQSQTYERQTVFLAPDQRRWLKDTARALPVDGLSASDIVRLALVRLRAAVDGGDVELVEALTKQAHAEAQRLAGRRNRGLPSLPGCW